MRKNFTANVRFGIGEWFGQILYRMPRKKILDFAASARLPKPDLPCPFRRRADFTPSCNKRGGVCSVRLYQQTKNGYSRPKGTNLVTLCPQRFWQDDLIFREISRSILGKDNPVLVKEVGFLRGERKEDVGRIDSVLAIPDSHPLIWCAVEIQAVYFSGQNMGIEFKKLSEIEAQRIPFPAATRRPDFRSSGPKRLMPQLQIKVPTLRRWGKKIAVVVDSAFFNSMGKMESTLDLSNADIAWFIMDYQIKKAGVNIYVSSVCYTTLEMAITGLTAGFPITLSEFEADILRRIPTGVFIS